MDDLVDDKEVEAWQRNSYAKGHMLSRQATPRAPAQLGFNYRSFGAGLRRQG